MFRRMKEWRRTAIRYDRLAGNFLSAIELIEVCANQSRRSEAQQARMFVVETG